MAGNAHNGAGAVIDQDIIRNPDGQALATDRIDGIAASESPGFVFGSHTIHRRFSQSGFNIAVHSGALVGARQCADQLMFRGQHHVGGTKQSVRPGCEDTNFGATVFNGKVDLSALTLADPVLLHFDDRFRPVQLIKVIQEPFCVCRNFKHPLYHIALGHGAAAAFALSAGCFLIGQAGLALRAPVNRHLFLIS